MKKNILIILCLMFLSIIFTGCKNSEKELQIQANEGCQKTKSFLNYDFGNSYQTAIKDSKPMLLVFYVNWCTYCRRLMPKLASLNNEYKDKYNIVLIDCEDRKNEELLKKYKIEYFPTIYIINKNNEIIVPGQYIQSLETFKLFLDKTLK